MEEYVRKMSESEGHFDFYESRKHAWNDFIRNSLRSLCTKLESEYGKLHGKWKNKADGSLRFRIEWMQLVRDIGKGFSSGDDKLDVQVIVSTVAKYALKYLQKDQQVSAPTRGKGSDASILIPHREAGLKVLSGGILGKMFKLYKRKRSIYSKELQIMKLLIVVEKESVFIPVEQRCRDNGGLYIIKDRYMDTIRSLDKAICQEFHHIKAHGQNIIKVDVICFLILC